MDKFNFICIWNMVSSWEMGRNQQYAYTIDYFLKVF